MNWHGPRGSCGCCGGACTCPSPCECYDRFGGAGLEGFLGFVIGHTLTLGGFPSVVSFTYRPAFSSTDSTISISGFHQFNDTFSWPLPSPSVDPNDDIFCADECYSEIIATKTVRVTEGGATYSGNPETCGAPSEDNFTDRRVQLRFVSGSIAPGGSCGFGLWAVDGFFIPVDCGCQQASGFWLNFHELNQFLSDGFNRGDRQCVNFGEGTVTNAGASPAGQKGLNFTCATGGGNFEAYGTDAITATLAPVVSGAAGIPHTGWTYTVSNVPSSFYLRISNSVKSYLITGMDVINGDYELELDDESDCTKSAIEFLSFGITAQEYQVSLSSPCTIVPVGMEIAATARLALPPTSAGVVVTIRIPGEIDKSILIDDWVPFGCDGYTEDAYIDHESTECFGNPDPILTLTQSPILG